MKKLFRNSMMGALISGSRLISGFFRGKFTALMLGVVGVGIFSQGNQLSLFGLTLSSLAMASGVINRVSVHHLEEAGESRQKVLSTAFSVQLSLCIVITLVGLIFSRLIAKEVFGSETFQIHAVLVVLSIPFSALATGFLQGLFVDPTRYAGLAKATVAANFIGLACFIPLVHHYDLLGAFIGLLVNSILLFLFYVLNLKKHFDLKNLFKIGFDREEFRHLIKFASVGLGMATISYGANLLIRSYVLRVNGSEANGILQVPIALTSYYSAFLVDVLWVQLYPLVSKKKDSLESREELLSVLKYVITLQTIIALSILVLQEFLIRFAYSASFAAAADLIPIQLIGDFFFFCLQAFSVYYLGASFFRINLIGWVLYYAITSAITIIFLNHGMSILAIPLVYAIVNAVFAFVVFGLFFYKNRLPPYSTLANTVICFLTLSVSAWITLHHFPWLTRLIPFGFFVIYFFMNNFKKGDPAT